MPPRFAPPRHVLVTVAALAAVSPAAAQDLPLIRDYPGLGRYQCPAPADVATPEQDALGRAAQAASDANQAMNLGDLEQAQELLASATDLNPLSADFAYRHARTLEDLGDAENALVEYCRALDLNIEEIGVFDVRDRIDALYERVRERIPAAARAAFVEGLERADSTEYQEAVESFSDAIDSAPGWGAPIYNRGLIFEELGRIPESLVDYRNYLALAPTDIDPFLVIVSERIGQLEGAASVETPSPTGALALGLVPGMGHYYTGRPLVGTLTLATAGSALAAGILFKTVITHCVEGMPTGGTCPPELIVDVETERPYLWYGIAAAAAVTVGGAIEALIYTRRRKAEAEAITGPDTGSDRDEGLALAPPSMTATPDRIDLNLLTFRFR